LIDHATQPVRAWVVRPRVGFADHAQKTAAALQEATALVCALPGLVVVGAEAVTLAKPHPGSLFGAGKVAQLGQLFHDHKIGLVLVDGAVSPVQQRNLEREWQVKLLDRTGLILEIFSHRARTREGVLQVEMAALSYQRTRLVRAWTHLERQRGGLGFVGGPGETQIEADRRAIDTQLVRLRRQLAKHAQTRTLHRAARARRAHPVVALVGYTNAGKSTLFNRLTSAQVLAQDMLFASLDPTMRRLALPQAPTVILSDTVGFISDLPTELVAAFRATLEDVCHADLILHVRDISHPDSAAQAATVEEILASMQIAPTTPRLEVWNKMDCLHGAEATFLRSAVAQRADAVAISARDGEGIEALRHAIARRMRGRRHCAVVALPYSEGHKRAWLFRQGVVVSESRKDDGFCLSVRWTSRQAAAFRTL